MCDIPPLLLGLGRYGERLVHECGGAQTRPHVCDKAALLGLVVAGTDAAALVVT